MPWYFAGIPTSIVIMYGGISEITGVIAEIETFIPNFTELMNHCPSANSHPITNFNFSCNLYRIG